MSVQGPTGHPDCARSESDDVVVRVSAQTAMVTGPEDVWLTGNQVAAMLNMPPATFRNYVAIGRAPKADDRDLETPQNRRRPRWLKSSIDAWRDSPQERAVRKRRRKRQADE